MTGDTLSSASGGVQRRTRANSLAAPALCDLYRRSFSEAPEGAPRPRVAAATRSHSVKVRKTRPPPEIDTAIPRWYCYRVRSFHLSSRGGVINRGDTLRYKQKAAEVPTQHEQPLVSKDTKTEDGGGGGGEGGDEDLKKHSGGEREKFRVQLLGASDVGKTALSKQFLTSEHIFVRSNLPEISSGENAVTILLNGQESQLTFTDGFKGAQQGAEAGAPGNEPDGYLVIYSVASSESFEHARKTLHELIARTSNKAVILVGNKSDLARARAVAPQEGRSLASSHNVKFIETSVGINHHVDELLVGMVAQIRLKQKGRGKITWPNLQKASFRVRRLFHRLVGKEEPPSPCDILHTL